MFYSKFILHVFVLISHLPPTNSPIEGVGISTCPVFVCVTNTVFDGNAPQTLPVLFFIKISGEIQLFNSTFPVFLFIKILSLAVTFLRKILPVLPLDSNFLHVTSFKFILPVFVCISIFPSLVIEFISTFPTLEVIERFSIVDLGIYKLILDWSTPILKRLNTFVFSGVMISVSWLIVNL